MPASGPCARRIVAPGAMPTTMPALALRSLREYWLMPLVTTRPGSEVAATTRAARAHAEAVDRAAVRGSGAPACSRPRRAAGGRRSGRSGRGRSAIAGARCGSRSRTAWLRGGRRASCSIAKVSRALWPSASTTWSARQRLAAASSTHAAHAALRRAASASITQVDDACCRSGSRRRAPRSRAHLLDHRRPGGRCRCAAWRRRGSPPARRP